MAEALRIPRNLDQGRWPPDEDMSERYSLNREGLNVYKLLQRSADSIYQTVDQIDDVYHLAPWGGEASLELFGSPENIIRAFHPITGAAQLSQISDGSIASFYTLPGRAGKLGGRLYNRGYRYYVGSDLDLDIDDKLSIIKDDIHDAQSIIGSRITPLETGDYLAFTGIADYLKNHALGLFHAISYPHIPGTTYTQEQYRSIKDHVFDLACRYTRGYYNILLGRLFDGFADSDDLIVDDALSIISADYKSRKATPFKIPEIDHPLRIMYGVTKMINRHSHTSVILVLPTGGTQVGIAAQLGYEILRNNKPRLHWVPVSLYSGNPVFNGITDSRMLDLYLEDLDLMEESVLVTEDNSNTGKTAQLIADSLDRIGVAQRSVSIVEADPIRAMNSKDENISNLLHPDFTPIGFVPVLRSHGRYGTRQMRKILARRVIGSYKEQDSNKALWEFARYPGRMGKNRDRYYSEWDEEFGKGNWRIAWEMQEGEILDFDQIFEEYVQAYVKYFQEHPDEATYICNNYQYAYDRDQIGVRDAFDRYALLDRPGIQNQFHHVAMNIALTDRLRYSFQGEKPIKVRAGRSDQPPEKWPEGHRWQPGNIQVTNPGMIRRDYEITDPWINGDSIEALYQANKILQVKKR